MTEYVALAGDVTAPADLTIPKARELARFLELGLDRGATLLETRRRGSTEVVVVSLSELEIGQAPRYPILDEERFAICFTPEDEFAPQVLALRNDFPDAPHINRTVDEIPRSLCLYDGPYDEVKLSWTAGRFIERIRIWIRDTARGALHREDQPLEPLLLASAYTLILPADLFSAAEDEAPDRLLIFGLSQTVAGKVLLAKRAAQVSPRERENASPIVCTLVSCPPQVHGGVRHVPSNLADLHELHMQAGLDLVADLRAKLLAWHRTDAPLDSPLLIVSRFPQQRRAGEEPETSQIHAFLCGKIRDVGVAVGAWQNHGQSVGVLLNGQSDAALLRTIAIDVLNPSFELSRNRAASANGEPADLRLIVAIGLGALGSQIVATLVRGGFGQWTLIDNDILMPHNAARHELNGYFAGYPKAEVLADHCNTILGGAKVAEHLVANALRPGEADGALVKAMGAAALVADFSASVAVARELATKPAGPRRLSAFLNPSGTDLVLLVEDGARTLRLDDLEMQYYRAILRSPPLSAHMRPPAGQVRYAQSCRDLSSTVPADLVKMHAAIAARTIRRQLASEEASITIWSADEDRNVSRITVRPEVVSEGTVGEWRVRWDRELERVVDTARTQHLPRETGGVLVGTFDPKRRIVYVIDALLSPPDSVEWPHLYIRGAEGLAEEVSAIEARTAGMLQYVGEWHSHPEGCSAEASGTDVEALGRLGRQMAFDGLPALMFIIGHHDRRWLIASL